MGNPPAAQKRMHVHQTPHARTLLAPKFTVVPGGKGKQCSSTANEDTCPERTTQQRRAHTTRRQLRGETAGALPEQSQVSNIHAAWFHSYEVQQAKGNLGDRGQRAASGSCGWGGRQGPLGGQAASVTWTREVVQGMRFFRNSTTCAFYISALSCA